MDGLVLIRMDLFNRLHNTNKKERKSLYVDSLKRRYPPLRVFMENF